MLLDDSQSQQNIGRVSATKMQLPGKALFSAIPLSIKHSISMENIVFLWNFWTFFSGIYVFNLLVLVLHSQGIQIPSSIFCSHMFFNNLLADNISGAVSSK